MDSGKQQAFVKDWRIVEGKLAGYFYRKGCPEEDSLDLVQETAIRAWRNYGTLKGDFKPWVFSIAKFTFIDYLRKKKQVDEIEDEASIQDLSPDPGSRAVNSELLRQCLEELEPIDRECLVLHDAEGYKFEIIAEMLGISVSNAHYHVDKARKYLCERFPDLVNKKKETGNEL